MNLKKEFTYILRRVIVAIIVILIMAFIDSKIPKALDMKSSNITASNISGYDRVFGGAYLKDNINLAVNQDFSFTLSGSNNISGYDYLMFGLQLNYNTIETYSETTNVYDPLNNTEYYCSSWAQKQTTYADGSQSTYYECQIWTPSGQSGSHTDSTMGTYNTKPDFGLSIYAIYNNGSFSPCEVNTINYGNTFVTCRIPNGVTNFTSIRFRNVGSAYMSNFNASVGIQTYWSAWKDSSSSIVENDNNNTQSIINNQNQNQQQSHQDMQDINNSINNSSVDSNNASTTINNASSLLPTDNNVSSLIGLPITFVESVLNGISGSCRPIHLFDLNMSDLENSSASDWSFTLDCIDLSSILGNTWVIIDTIMSALIVYAIAKFFVRIFIKITQMDYNIVEEAYKS